MAILETGNKLDIEHTPLSDKKRDEEAKTLAEKLRDRLGYPIGGPKAQKDDSRYIPLPDERYGQPQTFFIEVTDPAFQATLRIIADKFTFQNVEYPAQIEVECPKFKKPLKDTDEALYFASIIVAHATPKS